MRVGCVIIFFLGVFVLSLWVRFILKFWELGIFVWWEWLFTFFLKFVSMVKFYIKLVFYLRVYNEF